jgi:hypothetical protein
MAGWFRAIAIDYDGTLTEAAQPSAELLEALGRARHAAGLRLILVTGRILGELRRDFPDFADHFDLVVAENGAVLHGGGVARALTAPVPVGLDGALIHRGISFRRGQVLLACDGEYDLAVLEELRRLGLECQLSRNRDQLMVLPAGITKGSGVWEALSDLGISRHNAVAVGDAENDHPLLDACEIGVAVANAVPSLKERADLVLTQPGAAGVAELLGGPLLRDELDVQPSRWQVELGRSAGEAVLLPGSRINLLVTGGSGTGKSYAAGFLAERLVGLHYSLCVFDPEGDHAPLGRLPGVVLVGGREPLPTPAQLTRILERGLGSVVVDLSLAGAERAAYVSEALGALEKLRAEKGVPHWIFVDEAHTPLGAESLAGPQLAPASKGHCLITWRPMDLQRGALAGVDFVIALPGQQGIEPEIRDSLAGLGRIPAGVLQPEVTGLGVGRGVLIRLGPSPEVRAFELAPRWLDHVRHWHKYAGVRLPAPQRFCFRGPGGPNGEVAANLAEFHHEIRRCGLDVLRHHAGAADFSRWVEDVIQDAVLAEILRSIEARLVRVPGADGETIRREILEAIEARYLA